MIKYNNKEYANFEQFAKYYQNRYKNANFDKVNYQLSDKAKFDKSDIALSGVYQLPNGKKFFITSPFEGNYQEIAEKSGNVKNCNDSLQIIYLEKPNKKGKQIIKLNDSSQVDRTLQAMLDKSPTSVHAHGKKSKQITDEVIKAKFADFIEFCSQIGYTADVDVNAALAVYAEKQEENEKALKIAEIVKSMKVTEEVAERMYYAMKA